MIGNDLWLILLWIESYNLNKKNHTEMDDYNSLIIKNLIHRTAHILYMKILLQQNCN